MPREYPEASERVSQAVLYDTVNFDPRAIELAIAFAGVDHIMAGSDYPHQIGSIPRMLETIRGLDLSDQDKAAIFGGNAARLLKL